MLGSLQQDNQWSRSLSRSSKHALQQADWQGGQAPEVQHRRCTVPSTSGRHPRPQLPILALQHDGAVSSRCMNSSLLEHSLNEVCTVDGDAPSFRFAFEEPRDSCIAGPSVSSSFRQLHVRVEPSVTVPYCPPCRSSSVQLHFDRSGRRHPACFARHLA